MLVYTPTGRTLDLKLDVLEAADMQASWLDPRDGTWAPLGLVKGRGRKTFDPPGAEEPGNDWVLLIRIEKLRPETETKSGFSAQ